MSPIHCDEPSPLHAPARRPAAVVAPQAALVADLCRYIDAADTPPTLAELGARAGLSPCYVQRLFKRYTGLSPRAWAVARRAERVRGALGSGQRVSDALYEAGYGSSGRFYEDSDRALGMMPGAFRAGAAGEDIRFAVGQCTLGAILVASGSRGVCAISLGDDPQALIDELQARFPAARLIGADPGFETLVAHAAALVEAPGSTAHLPLDLRGTAFQRRVWQALQAIPPGETVSYTELARRIGAPAAVRAVASACAANALAVAIPCHRVVRTDGGLAGYRWGIERKRALLEREGAL